MADLLSYALDPTGDIARRRAAEINAAKARARGQASISAYRAPTAADTVYDALGSAYGGLHRLLGADEREAARSGHRAREALSGLVEGVVGPAELEEATNRITSGKGTKGDYAVAALTAAPMLPKPVKNLAVGAVKAVTPAAVRRGVGTAADWLGHVPEMVTPESFRFGRGEVSMPGTASPTLRVAGAPEGRSLTVPGVRRVGPAPTARAAAVVAPRVLEGPPGMGGLPSPEGATPLPPRSREWWPDKEFIEGGDDPSALGWRVRDRGEHAHPDYRYAVDKHDNVYTQTFHPSEEEAWAKAAREVGGRKINQSPEAAARKAANEGYVNWGVELPVADWLEKSLAKYYKRDFGTEADPLADLAERGLHYDPEMTADRWREEANSVLTEDPLGYYTVPQHATAPTPYGYDATLGPQLTEAAPWLAGKPVTDLILGMRGRPDTDPFMDEFAMAVRDAPGLPADLRIDPARLNRMTFPQAVERVGRIKQWKAAEAEKAALTAQANPAIKLHKEYPDDPKGMRWVEIGQPDLDLSGYRFEQLPEGDYNAGQYQVFDPMGARWRGTAENVFGSEEDARRAINRSEGRQHVEDALQFEGNEMGHCVGGYCPEVMSGRTGIFSLRDKQGKPHVTIETTAPVSEWDKIGSNAIPDESPLADIYNQYYYGTGTGGQGYPRHSEFPAHVQANHPELFDPDIFEARRNIEQIKGKQNDMPVESYLPYVQDFVKSQPWGRIEELGNAGLVRLPDGRYLDEATYNGIIDSEGLDSRYQGWNYYADEFPRDPQRLDPDDWEQFQRHFQGYAYGGRVERDRDFAYGPLAVHMADGGRVDRDVIAEAAERYPFIRDLDPLAVEGDRLEVWQPGETGTKATPRHEGVPLDRLGIQGPPGMPVEDFVGEALHADPRAIAARDALWSTLTPEQTARLQREAGDYGVTLEEGGTEDRAMQNAVDSLIRGYTLGQWPKEAIDRFGLDEVQQDELNGLRRYMAGER